MPVLTNPRHERRLPLSSYRLPPQAAKIVTNADTGQEVVVAPYDRMGWKARLHEVDAVDETMLAAAVEDGLVPYDRHECHLNTEPNTVLIAYERGHEMVLG